MCRLLTLNWAEIDLLADHGDDSNVNVVGEPEFGHVEIGCAPRHPDEVTFALFQRIGALGK